MVLRSDEIANESEIERDKRFRSNVGKGIATAASLGTAAIAPGIASKIMPFLNQYVPTALAVKGIDKISPKLGSFLKKGQEMGLNIEEGLDFIKQKLGGEKKSENAKDNRNIIEQYSPELHQFILGEIQNGRSPLEAGAIATLSRKGEEGFKKIIDQIVKDHKTPWSAILETVYGSQKGGQKTPNPTAQGGQSGPGQQALMDILNKINQRLGQ